MAIERELNIDALPSIYSKNRNNIKRNLKVYYSIPSKGINEDTGFLMYISGFRGHAQTNVCKKLRRELADKYNLVTIQCDYFGSKFMQKPEKLKPLDKHMDYFTKSELIKIYKRGKFNIDTFLELAAQYELKMKIREDLSEENEEEFNEMGIMQAMDNLNALMTIMKKLKEENYKFNSKKVILYGNSHGAYLCHLCSLLAPNLVSLVIDNSGWVYPEHIKEDKRSLTLDAGKTKVKVVFDYIARNILDDHEIISLHYLYSRINNNTRIIAYHGENDHLITEKDKKKFIDCVSNSELNIIREEDVDNDVFGNTKHGIGANFLKLFDKVMNEKNVKFDKSNELNIPETTFIQTSKYAYIFDFTGNIPQIIRHKKC